MNFLNTGTANKNKLILQSEQMNGSKRFKHETIIQSIYDGKKIIVNIHRN